jgi:23S rRNA (guanosine2251-2'-O)-methyltransferase
MSLQKHYVCGVHAVQAVLEKSPDKLKVVLIVGAASSKRLQALQMLATEQGVLVRLVKHDELTRLVDEKHQGVVAELHALVDYNRVDVCDYVKQCPQPVLLLVLDGVQDPHNLGACLRSMAAANATAVIIPNHHAVTVNATVSKVACGAAEYVPVFQVSNLVRCLQRLKEQNIWIYGFSADAKQAIYETDLTQGVALVLGAEGTGMRQLTEKTCDQLVTIPMVSHVVSSLNVSVAAGISLFEAVRQRR